MQFPTNNRTNLRKTVLTDPQESNGLQTNSMWSFIIGKPDETIHTIHEAVSHYLIKVF